MAALVIPNTVLYRIIWTAGGVAYAVNILGGRKTSMTVDQARADAVSAAFKSAFTSSGLAAVVHSTIALWNVGIRDISSPSLPEFLGSGAASNGTQAAGKLLPAQVAQVITLRTAKAGKSFRGRVYIPGFGDSALATDGTATSAATTAAKAFVDAVKTATETQGAPLAVVSRLTASNELVTSTQSRSSTWETVRGRAIAGI